MRKLVTIPLILATLVRSADAYGPRGHALVGAVADRRLAKSNTSVKDKVKELLDGLTLERAAKLPDDIKACDTNPNGFKLTGHSGIEADLRAFVAANPHDGTPSHHDFHFTDVPVVGSEKYATGQVGRSDSDIVHMIPFCIRVVNGKEPETNERKITKPVAVILLAHYLGDIHQPLHVGAQYFDADGKPFEPSPADKGFADQGGNKLTLYTFFKGKLVSAGKFHGYWDGQTVENAFGATADSTVAKRLADKEPTDWKLTGGVETWAETLADEIMPIAREAHERLAFKKIKLGTGDRDIKSGRAEEKKKTGGKFYATWAAAAVKAEIHKGGWRLAALLEAALQ